MRSKSHKLRCLGSPCFCTLIAVHRDTRTAVLDGTKGLSCCVGRSMRVEWKYIECSAKCALLAFDCFRVGNFPGQIQFFYECSNTSSLLLNPHELYASTTASGFHVTETFAAISMPHPCSGKNQFCLHCWKALNLFCHPVTSNDLPFLSLSADVVEIDF